MKIAIYLRHIHRIPRDYFEKLFALDISLIVEGPDLQKSSIKEEFLSRPSQVQILSIPFENGEEPVSRVLQDLQHRKFTHAVFIESWSPELGGELLQIKETIAAHPNQIINFIPVQRLEQNNSLVMRKLFDVGATDYRSYHARDRVYPLAEMEAIQVVKEDLLYSRRLLLKAVKNHRPIVNRPVSFEVDKKYRSIFYYLRRYYYDFLLLSYSTIHRQSNPLHSALSFAAGIFLACSPFYGLQTLLIVIVTWLFRLSFPVAFLGSQISLPPTYSLIVPLQIYVGFYVTGMEPQFNGEWPQIIKDHFYNWAVGSLIVGSLFAMIGGLIWYVIIHRRLKSISGQSF